MRSLSGAGSTRWVRGGGAAYAAALLVGLAWSLTMFPPWMLRGEMLNAHISYPDQVQHVTGQQYFWHQPWHLRRFLVARDLGVPQGTMIGFTDSLPLLTVLLKPFVFLFPAGFEAVTPWLVLCWVLQPVMAVFALRAAGESRFVPALAVAACASAMPTLLLRIGHVALSSHFLILWALGLSLRLAAGAPSGRTARRTLGVAASLVPALLLIHPYLMAMAAALLFAAPVTLAIRGDRRGAAVVAFVLVASCAFTVVLAELLGYGGTPGAAGFGVFSMNLEAPFRPDTSALLHRRTLPGLDATGGQYEGFQYLGAGLLGGLAALPLLPHGRRMLRRLPVRHPGLLLVCAGLTLFALSDRIYLGHVLLLSLPEPPGASAFRASGRFFWPVAYALLVGTIATLAGVRAPYGRILLVAMIVVQTLDVRVLRTTDWFVLRTVRFYSFDPATLEAAMRRSTLLDIYPAWPCDASAAAASNLMDVIGVADRVRIPVTTMYSARPAATVPARCDAATALGRPLRPGELRVILPGYIDRTGLVPDATRICHRNGNIDVCERPPPAFPVP